MSTRYNTGNQIESTDVRDMSDNAKNFDEFSNSMSDSFTDRFGVDRQTMEGAVRKAGFRPASFDFLTGGSLVSGDRNKAVFNPAPPGDNNWYAWQGAFPKIISPNSTPSTSGGLGDNAWKPVTNNILAPTVMESIRRSYAEAGYNLVDGSFEAGGTLVNANDVLLQERTGKGLTGPAGPVAAGTDPASWWFVDRSGELLKGRLASSAGAAQIGTATQGKNVQDLVDAPYIITGSVNIANPRWGAPATDTDDPAAAAANHAALQMMLNSGAKRCSTDSKPRYLTNTLIMDTRGQTFCGQGKDDEGIIFYGGDIPIISRADPTNINGLGKPGMRVEHMRIADRSATRVNAWSINLTNGDSNGVDSIFLDGIAGLGATANYGVALGLAYGSTLQPSVVPTFVCHIRNSRLSLAKAILNTSDSYVESNELWGNSRDLALQVGAGANLIQGNQIVPGSQAGLLFKSQNNFLLNILRVLGNYFDGSYTSVVTGPGIACDPNSGVTTSAFNDNTFWHINSIGARFTVFNDSEFKGIFEDCASDDAANTPDLYIESMSGSKIDCTHKRSVNAPKTGAPRVNLSPSLQVSAGGGQGAVNYVSQNVTSKSTYLAAQIGNPAYVVDEGRILNRSTDQTPVNGTIQIKVGIAYICVNGVWKPFAN